MATANLCTQPLPEATNTRDGVQAPLRLLLYALFAAAALLYQDYGLPECWGSDELSHVVHGMLRDQRWNPRLFNYPAGLLIHLSHLVLKVTAWLHLPVGADLGTVTRVCRSVNACFYLLTIFCLEGAIKVITSRRYANLALLMAGSTCALLAHAHVAESNAGFFFGISLAVYQFCRLLRSRRPGDFYLSVCAASLAVGCKYNAIHLFVCLPILWLMCFRPYRWGTFLKHLAISLAIAPVPFFLTNPFVALDSAKAFEDVFNVAVKEAPWFQTPLSPREFALVFHRCCKGFFSPPIHYGMLVTLVAGMGVILWRLGKGRRDPLVPAERLAFQGLILAGILFGSCAVLTFRIKIFQSRYLVPLGMYYSFAFLIVWYRLPSLVGSFVERAAKNPVTGRRRLALRLAFLVSTRTLQAGLVLLLVCVGAAQLYAFASAPRQLATSLVRRLVRESPTTRIGLISYPRRSAIRRGLPEVEERVTEFMTMNSPESERVDTWPRYLDTIQDYFASNRPDVIVAEDVVMHWSVFLPRSDAGDYSQRLHYVNPGPQEWQHRLEAIGYRLDRVIRGPGGDDRVGRLLRALIGHWYLDVAEARGGNVYLFAKTHLD
jgi:hypothetical protein